MQTITSRKKYFVLVLLFVFTTLVFAQSQAIYTVTFSSSWNDPDHGTLPVNAHWSDLVGATHNSNVIFWENGSLATPGIEDVAETGDNLNFNDEVDDAITNGDADQWLQHAFDAPNNALSGVTIMNITVDENFPLLTLVSMIAPSPDWFIGINSFSLLDGINNWKDNISIDMYPYDAGTEEGIGYSTTNSASSPHVNIFDRSIMVPFTGPKIGTLTISLESVLNVDSVSFDNGISIAPNPASNIISISNNSVNRIQSIDVYNVLGKMVESIPMVNSNRTTELSVSHLNSGVYLLRINGERNQSIVKKLIVK